MAKSQGKSSIAKLRDLEPPINLMADRTDWREMFSHFSLFLRIPQKGYAMVILD